MSEVVFDESANRITIKETAARQSIWRTALGYSSPSLGAAILGVLFYVYIPNLYSEIYSVPIAAVGVIVFLSRVWDAIIDPLVGYLCDRTASRFGRRKIWIVLSAPAVAAVFYFLCAPPESLSVTSATWWFAVGTFLFFLFWTTLSIPFEALGTEIVSDYNDRTLLFSVRQGVIVLGTILAGVFPALFTVVGAQNPYASWGSLALIVGAILILGSLCLSFFVTEKISTVDSKAARVGFFELLRCAKKNPHFMNLLIGYTISGFGASLPATLIVYYVNNVIGVESPALYLSLYFLVGFGFLPFWVWLSKRIGKRDAWIYSMLVNTAAFVCVIPLGRGDDTLYAVLVALSGIGYGGSLALPASMQADVLDYEAAQRGLRREGEFIALWSIANKLAAALGAGLAFPILALSGYIARAQGDGSLVMQNSTTLFALSILYAAVPSLCNLCAIVIARRYSLTEAEVRLYQSGGKSSAINS